MRYLNKGRSAVDKPITNRELIAEKLTTSLSDNLDNLEHLLANCSDAVIKRFKFSKSPVKDAAILYFDGLTDRNEIELNILKPLMLEMEMLAPEYLTLYKAEDIFSSVKNSILSMADVIEISTLQEVSYHIASGDTVILIDGFDLALVADTRSWQMRSVETPDNEVVVFGPKEGFNETLRINTALLRRRIKSTNFKIEAMILGRVTKTDVVLCYIDNIAPEGLVNEVRERLEQIDIDAVLDTSYIKELIADNPNTIFTQFEHTEKPDKACSHLLEGRICIIVDGSPMALIAPITFPQFLISSEDYYTHYIPASLFRLLRFGAMMIALFLPALYVAIITYHHEMIPTSLYLTIAATRQSVPFPPFIEALLLELTFEMLREAGLRLPKAVGPAVSIVGALIIGDAAVRAGLVSTPMVVVVAFTGIASFVTPAYNAGIIIRVSRFGFLIAGALLGFLGIVISLVLFLTRMVSLTSFGQPYLAPIAPLNMQQITDVIVRRPWEKSNKRPYMDGMKNQTRQANSPPDNKEN
ncbi:MAG TPA: spore germination protein [Syntrophomonadaceae bacterium]|nr:spore germination protein [Syntrophomonadaceae bacterium]